MFSVKISIVTPSYQQARFVRRTLDSVLVRQDYQNIEHIVVDGLSTDGTLDILKEYQARYPEKFRFIYEKDSGQSSAINKGFRQAKGDIIGWINSDDYYEDNIFAFVVEFFEKHPEADMIYGGCNLVDAADNFLESYEDGYGFKKCGIRDYKTFSYNTLMNVYSGLIPQQSVFFRRSIFEKVGCLDESYHFTMDYEYWLRIGRKCQIMRVDRVLADFRTHGDAKTNSKNMFKFITEAMRARKANGGKFAWRYFAFNLFLAVKTLGKQIAVGLGWLK